jgi:hypothetical protein
VTLTVASYKIITNTAAIRQFIADEFTLAFIDIHPVINTHNRYRRRTSPSVNTITLF